MDTSPYHVGDRVRLTHPIFGLTADTPGVIILVSNTIRTLYCVYFVSIDIALTIHSRAFVREPDDTHTPRSH